MIAVALEERSPLARATLLAHRGRQIHTIDSFADPA